jgi:hypothetical protein
MKAALYIFETLNFQTAYSIISLVVPKSYLTLFSASTALVLCKRFSYLSVTFSYKSSNFSFKSSAK